ncbi:MAG: hypothetical protein KHY91_16780 [Roseburia sp.]|nr:hypothetical protein [Roseburia sp.]
MAKEGIRLESMTGIAMQGMSDIMALYAEGASSLCVNGSVDMLGRLAGISASKYTGYPPYDDAPKEGEFDWEGFTRNLATGLGVVAVCAIGAAISIATLGAGSILAGAFIGAGIGALSTTAMKAGEEISTGNVRSAKEAFRDVGISAVSGFITGAYEKWAYAFDPGQMVADFVTGVVIGEILDGIMAATQNKLRSIFANSDEMRWALDSGNKTKPYANSRPSFRKGVVEEVWENAKGPDGLVRDPNTGDIINWTPGQSRKGVWDMGHIPEAKYSEMHEAYMNGELTTKEFVDWYNDPANYRPELPSNNRSHKYE